jgi:outer membrane protein assembly factor BamB
VWLAYDGGHVYALNGSGGLTALDVTTGTQVWTTQLTGQSFFQSPPVAAGGMVYVNGLGFGGLTYGVDGATGATVWKASTFDGSDGAVAVAGGLVYEAEACDQLSAFDALTGHVDWFHSGNCTGGGGAAPAVYQGRVWERDWAMGNVIIDSTGKSAGSFNTSVIPSFHGGTAFYLASNTLSAVALQSGTLKWSFSGDGQLCTSAAIAGGGGQVFVASQAGKVYELDEATGAQRSVSALGSPASCSSETQSMALASNHLFVPAGNTLVAY